MSSPSQYLRPPVPPGQHHVASWGSAESALMTLCASAQNTTCMSISIKQHRRHDVAWHTRTDPGATNPSFPTLQWAGFASNACTTVKPCYAAAPAGRICAIGSFEAGKGHTR